MSFQFRFASILQLRLRERDTAGAAVGQADEAIRRVDEQITVIQQQRQSLRAESDVDRVGNLSVDSLLASGRYDLQLQGDIGALEQTRLELMQELQRRQHVLREAEAEVKRFERLKEKEQQQFQAEQLRREQFESDEATARRYTITRTR